MGSAVAGLTTSVTLGTHNDRRRPCFVAFDGGHGVRVVVVAQDEELERVGDALLGRLLDVLRCPRLTSTKEYRAEQCAANNRDEVDIAGRKTAQEIFPPLGSVP